jgi:iron complex outermembrane receptor protein
VERIEVVRGSSALYGNSAGAGFINYITRDGEKGPARFSSEMGGQISLSSFGDGVRPSFRQSVEGGGEKIDYQVIGYIEETGGFYDADGDRIAPIPNGASGSADSSLYSYFGKFGYDIDSERRLEFSVNKFHQEQDTDYTLLNGDVSRGIKARAVRKPDDYVEEAEQVHENLVAFVNYSDVDVWGSSVNAQVYYQESESIFEYSATRFPLTEKPSAQTRTQSEKKGLRLDINTPLELFGRGSTFLWGVDYLRDDTNDDLVDGRLFAPPQELESKAVFAQWQFSPFDRTTITAGIRYEDATLDILDFTSLFTLANIHGGELTYDATPVNLGITYDINDVHNVFAGYSEGFEVASTGRALRSWPVDVNVVILDPQPNVVDSYEIGLRSNWESVSTTVAVFYVESTNGQAFRPDPANPSENVIEVRSADEVYGIEMTLDAELTDSLSVGGNFSWLEGKEDTDNDGDYDTWLANRRIPPPIATMYLQYDLSGWKLRAQGMYSGNRDRFPSSSTAFYQGEINDWFTLDLSATGRLGPGYLSVGINNATNTDHFTHISESMQQDSVYSKAPGATMTVKYRYDF